MTDFKKETADSMNKVISDLNKQALDVENKRVPDLTKYETKSTGLFGMVKKSVAYSVPDYDTVALNKKRASEIRSQATAKERDHEQILKDQEEKIGDQLKEELVKY